jgi:RimJ/RimL family protein N-acetyltransferase
MTDPLLIDIPERLEGERVVLLAPAPGRGAEMAVVIAQSISHLRPWMIWAQEPPTAESAEIVMRRMHADFFSRTDLSFQIFARREDGRAGSLLGGTGLHRIDWAARVFEIGYWLRPQASGQGLVGEAVRLLCRLAFEQLDARRIEIRSDALNTRSRAVAQRAGFQLEGVLRQNALGVEGQSRDTCVYSMLAAEFKSG